jgi:hypothetical protein
MKLLWLGYLYSLVNCAMKLYIETDLTIYVPKGEAGDWGARA